ncbi:MAG: hypothetical protein ACT4OY_02935 [Alphaproteobacteria bacterium]
MKKEKFLADFAQAVRTQFHREPDGQEMKKMETMLTFHNMTPWADPDESAIFKYDEVKGWNVAYFSLKNQSAPQNIM